MEPRRGTAMIVGEWPLLYSLIVIGIYVNTSLMFYNHMAARRMICSASRNSLITS